MKNQYFGDVNDYRKYGLLRTITKVCGVRIGMSWMLTRDDGRTDGKFTAYLSKPSEWRRYNPEIFDSLATCMQTNKREIKLAETENLVPGSKHILDYLQDGLTERQSYIESMLRDFEDCDLIFFDPDNGLEAKSPRKGNKNSSKFVYWDEIEATFKLTQSILFYQHFRREKREPFIRSISLNLIERLNVPEVISFRTSHVVFFLVSRHQCIIGNRNNILAALNQNWGDQFRINIHMQDTVVSYP